jgi:D-sedoheptulose 7-phosphate isomerase
VKERLAALIEERERVLAAFLAAEHERIARCCHAMARAFGRGATLIAYGTGAAATDAAHVAVEFMHPVIVGKRALPALAPTNDPTGRSTLERLARPGDVALAIAHARVDDRVAAFLSDAHDRDLLTIALVGAGADAAAGHVFVVPSDDAAIVQEVQETTYHVLWELVHVFFEHPGLLKDACITCGDVAVEARVVEVRGRTAVIEKDGAREEVAADLVDPLDTGDTVLCHAGVILERLA